MNQEGLQASLRMLEKQDEQAYEQARLNGTLTSRDQMFYTLTHDPAFVEKAKQCTSLEELWALFASNNAEVTPEEKDQLVNTMKKLKARLENNGGELSDEDLEQVAGGFLVGLISFLGGVAIGLLIGQVGVLALDA